MDTQGVEGFFPQGAIVGRKEGFTLIELLVVVAIIGILAAIAIPQYATYKQGAADAAAKSDIHNLATAFEAFFTQTNTYAGATLVSLTASNGFRQSPTVTAGIDTQDSTHFVVHASASGGSGTYAFDSANGQITGP